MRSSSERADHGTIKERVYQELKNDIVSGVLDMGQPLREGDLAAKHRVSKTPVREALALLVQEGLVEVKPRVGYLTSHVTLQDIEDIFDLRLIVETASAERAAQRISEDALQYLDHLVARYRPGDRDSYRLFLQENLIFHRTIASYSGNRRLEEVVLGLLEQMHRLLMLRLGATDTGDEMLAEHGWIVAALRQRDAKAAGELMARSIVGARKSVVESLIQRMSNWRI